MRFIIHNRLVIFTLASIVGLFYLWSPYYLILTFIGYFLMSSIGHDIGLHRFYTHRSFTCTWYVESFIWFCIFISCVTNSIIGYVQTHKHHHRTADTVDDFHPTASNPWLAWFRYADVDSRYINVDELLNNKFHKFMQRHQYKVYFAFLLIVAYFNLYVAFYFLILPSALAQHVASATIVFCHLYGYRNFNTPDNSRNNIFINSITGGLGLHNNHHANPASYNQKVKPNEIDISGWLIKHVLATSVKE
jgi:sn-1 stearoyl-lipid 9-desaturase